MTSITDKKQLQKYQRLSLWTISPNAEGYSYGLAKLNIIEINTTLDIACLRYIYKAEQGAYHPLQNYTIQYISNRSIRTITARHSALYAKSLVHRYI